MDPGTDALHSSILSQCGKTLQHSRERQDHQQKTSKTRNDRNPNACTYEDLHQQSIQLCAEQARLAAWEMHKWQGRASKQGSVSGQESAVRKFLRQKSSTSMNITRQRDLIKKNISEIGRILKRMDQSLRPKTPTSTSKISTCQFHTAQTVEDSPEQKKKNVSTPTKPQKDNHSFTNNGRDKICKSETLVRMVLPGF